MAEPSEQAVGPPHFRLGLPLTMATNPLNLQTRLRRCLGEGKELKGRQGKRIRKEVEWRVRGERKGNEKREAGAGREGRLRSNPPSKTSSAGIVFSETAGASNDLACH